MMLGRVAVCSHETQRVLVSGSVDWLELDAAFWIASFDSEPGAFKSLLRATDPKTHRVVTSHYAEYLRMRRLLKRETRFELIIADDKKKARRRRGCLTDRPPNKMDKQRPRAKKPST